MRRSGFCFFKNKGEGLIYLLVGRIESLHLILVCFAGGGGFVLVGEDFAALGTKSLRALGVESLRQRSGVLL